MAVQPHEPMNPRRPLLALSCWVGLFVLYEVLAGSPSWAEAVAGALASMAATVAVFVSGSAEHLGRIPWRWWWRLLRRLPPQIVSDTVRVLAAAMAPTMPSGRMRTVPFEPGGDDTEGGSRRALVVFAASMAPNAFVVQVDRLRKAMLMHEFVPKESPPGGGDLRWPI